MILNPVGLTRTDDHRYYWNGEGPLVSVTTVIGIVDKSGPLIGWAKRITAEAAVDHHAEIPGWIDIGGRDGAVSFLTKAATAKRDRAASAGSEVHSLAEAISRGHEVVVPDELIPYVASFLAWLRDWQPEYLAAEEMVVSLRHGYAGTFDAIVRVAGETWIVDYKTSKGIYPETALQLAAYSHADFVGRPGIARRFRLPRVDGHAVLHLTPDGYRFVPYAVTEATFGCFLHALALWNWQQGEAARVMGEPLAPRIKEAAHVG